MDRHRVCRSGIVEALRLLGTRDSHVVLSLRRELDVSDAEAWEMVAAHDAWVASARDREPTGAGAGSRVALAGILGMTAAEIDRRLDDRSADPVERAMGVRHASCG